MTRQSAGRDPVDVSPATEARHVPLSLRTALEAWGLVPENFEESLASHGWEIVRKGAEQEAAAIDVERLAEFERRLTTVLRQGHDLEKPGVRTALWIVSEVWPEYARLATPPTDPAP